MTKKISVCIPAYRSHDFIEKTLESVQRQAFKNFKVFIALEPTEDCERTILSCSPFLKDPRFSLSINPSVLGWAENVRSLLTRVETPFFTVLPHDDSWDSDYLSELHNTLQSSPEASVAFSDIQERGARNGVQKLEVDNESLFSRLSSFFLSGAHAIHWRGLTRTSCVQLELFPSNPFQSFAVECVWSSYWLTRGKALRAPRALYEKKIYSKGDRNVSSQWRASTSDEWILQALKCHKKQILSSVKMSLLPSGVLEQALILCEIATLKRSIEMLADRPKLLKLYAHETERLQGELCLLEGLLASKAKSLLHLIQARYFKTLGLFEKAEEAAMRAVRQDSKNWEAYVMQSLLLLKRGKFLKAQHAAEKSYSLAPYSEAAQRVMEMTKQEPIL